MTELKILSLFDVESSPLQGDKKKNEIETLKPGIRKSIKQSIKIKDRIYKDMIKNKNIQLHQMKEKYFKKYCNER